MRTAFFVSILAVATLLVTGAIAQHEGHEGHEAAPPSDTPVATPAGGGMMQGGMMAEHAQVAKLADQLATSFAAIENEKDSKKLQEKLAEHGKLLKQLQATLQGSAQKMEKMKGKMMGGSNKQ